MTEPSDGVAGTHVFIEGHGFSFGSMPQVFFDGVPAAVLQFRPDLGSLIAEVPVGLTPGDNELTVYNPDLDRTSDPACFATAAGSYTPVCTIGGLVIDFSSAIEDAVVVVLADGGERFVRADVSDASGRLVGRHRRPRRLRRRLRPARGPALGLGSVPGHLRPVAEPPVLAGLAGHGAHHFGIR